MEEVETMVGTGEREREEAGKEEKAREGTVGEEEVRHELQWQIVVERGGAEPVMSV